MLILDKCYLFNRNVIGDNKCHTNAIRIGEDEKIKIDNKWARINNPLSINFANFLLEMGENRIDIERAVGEKSIKMPVEYIFQSQH